MHHYAPKKSTHVLDCTRSYQILLLEWFPYLESLSPLTAPRLLLPDILPVFLRSISVSSYDSRNDRVRLLADRLLAGQRCLQGRARGRQVRTGAGLKHGGDVEGLEAET